MKNKFLVVSIMLTAFFFSLTASPLFLYGKNNNSAEFKKTMKETGVVFKMPKGFKKIPLVLEKRKIVNYLCAIKSKNKKIEIRYSLYPYKESVKSESKVSLGSDNTYKQLTYSVLLNISGDDKKILRAVEFKKEDVKKEFNADRGSTNLVEPGSLFGEGYELAMIVALYKSGSGHAYITYLFNDFEEIEEVFESAFESLRFK